MELPAKRVKNSEYQQTIFNLIFKFNLSLFLNFLLFNTLEIISTLVYKFKGYYSNPEQYLENLVDYHKSTCNTRKVAIITGANGGIGFVTADYLYRAGYLIILACRSENKAINAINAIKEINANKSDGEVKFIQLDCNSLESVKNFVHKFESLNLKLDLLVNNAGILLPPYQETQDGFESQVGVNYISHFYLTDLLIPYLNQNAKIINMGSLSSFWCRGMELDNILHKGRYNSSRNYSQSKIAMLLFTYYLHERYSSNNILAYVVHPGAVATNIFNTNPIIRKLSSISHVWFKSTQSGVFTVLRCALLPPPKEHGKNSLYYCEETLFPPYKSAYSQESINELIKWTREIIQSKGFQLKSFN